MTEIFKICTKCNKNLPLSNYSSNKHGRYGKQPRCKNCDKQYRIDNETKLKEYRKKKWQKQKNDPENIIKRKEKYIKNFDAANKSK